MSGPVQVKRGAFEELLPEEKEILRSGKGAASSLPLIH